METAVVQSPSVVPIVTFIPAISEAVQMVQIMGWISVIDISALLMDALRLSPVLQFPRLLLALRSARSTNAKHQIVMPQPKFVEDIAPRCTHARSKAALHRDPQIRLLRPYVIITRSANGERRKGERRKGERRKKRQREESADDETKSEGRGNNKRHG